MSITPNNPYTKSAIETLSHIRTDPQNERAYLQRAAAYAAVAQALELENISIVVENSTSILAAAIYQLERMNNVLESWVPGK